MRIASPPLVARWMPPRSCPARPSATPSRTSCGRCASVSSRRWPSSGLFDALVRADLREAEAGNLGSPVKAATDVLRDTREALRSAVEYGGLTPASHRYFVEEFNAVTNRISFGPPRRRNLEYRRCTRPGSSTSQADRGPAASGRGRRAVPHRSALWRARGNQPGGRAHRGRLDAYSPLTDASPLSDNLLGRGLVRPYLNGGYHPGGIEIDQQLHPVGADGVPEARIWIVGFPVEGPHFYTHALPRPRIASRQTRDADQCVRELIATIGVAATKPARPAPDLYAASLLASRVAA